MLAQRNIFPQFYNGILWLLQNKIYDSELKRMISDISIPRLDFSYFQDKIASKRAINDENTFDIGVKIVFAENDSNYSISKIIHFRKNGGNWKTNEKREVVRIGYDVNKKIAIKAKNHSESKSFSELGKYTFDYYVKMEEVEDE